MTHLEKWNDTCASKKIFPNKNFEYSVCFISLGPDMDVCLQEYGHCNFISEKHCSIFYDEVLLSYVVALQN